MVPVPPMPLTPWPKPWVCGLRVSGSGLFGAVVEVGTLTCSWCEKSQHVEVNRTENLFDSVY